MKSWRAITRNGVYSLKAGNNFNFSLVLTLDDICLQWLEITLAWRIMWLNAYQIPWQQNWLSQIWSELQIWILARFSLYTHPKSMCSETYLRPPIRVLSSKLCTNHVFVSLVLSSTHSFPVATVWLVTYLS